MLIGDVGGLKETLTSVGENVFVRYRLILKRNRDKRDLGHISLNISNSFDKR